jgi:hypothetical protein
MARLQTPASNRQAGTAGGALTRTATFHAGTMAASGGSASGATTASVQPRWAGPRTSESGQALQMTPPPPAAARP